MEPNFDTSFIPKRPMFREEAGVRRHEPIPVVTLLGFAVFFAALILTGLAFFFDQKEKRSLEDLAAQLASEKSAYNPEKIEELKSFSARLSHAKEIVDNHTAVSPLLNFLEGITLKSIYYDSFTLGRDENNGYKLRVAGKSPSYGLIYAQIDAFRNEPRIREVIIENTALEEQSGGATFAALLLLSPEVVKYIPPIAPNPQGQPEVGIAPTNEPPETTLLPPSSP